MANYRRLKRKNAVLHWFEYEKNRVGRSWWFQWYFPKRWSVEITVNRLDDVSVPRQKVT